MSRGLGVAQRRALVVLTERWDGIPVVELADVLGLTERRCRTMVTALVVRGEAVVAECGPVPGRRVWTPEGLTHALDLWTRSGRKVLA
jgi:hypothetical protein